MANYVESGLMLDLPDGQHFRFSDLPAYRQLCGFQLKEMDFAWIQSEKLFLLEVRSYAVVSDALTGAHFVPVKDQPNPFRFQSLIDKVSDSLLMLLAAWADTERGRTIRDALPAAARTRLPIKLVVALDLPSSLAVHLQSLRDSLNAQLRGRIALADVGNVVLVDYTRLLANPMFSPFITAANAENLHA